MANITRKEGLLLLGLFGLGVWVYLRSLRGPFIVDDIYTIVWNFPLRNLAQAGEITKQNLFAALGIETSYFRPLTQLSFALDFHLWGLNPLGYKLTSLALHLGNGILLFYLVKRFLTLAQSAFVTSVFLVHPVNMQAIAYISSRSDPLYFLFTVLTVYLWITDNITLRPFCLITFLLALFSKEPAVVTPALILLADLVRSESWIQVRYRLGKNLLWYIGLGGVLSAYLVLRLWILGYPLPIEAGMRELALSQRLYLAPTLLGKHLILLLFPIRLAFVHVVSLSFDPFAPSVFAPLLIVIGLAYLAAKLWHLEKAVALGLGWFLIATLPYLNLSPLNLPLMESWLYLSEIGLFIMITSLFGLVVKSRYLRVFAACAIVALLTMRAVVRSADWGNPVRLFEKNVQLYPESDIAWAGLAQAYGQVSREKESLEAEKKATELRPDTYLSYFGLGLHYFVAGEDDKAKQALLQAIGKQPDIAWPYYTLGIIYFKSSLWKKAQEEFIKALRDRPHIPMLYHLIGSTHLALGETGQAQEAFQKALEETPGRREYHAGIHVELGGLLEKRGRMKDAKREFELALRFDPENKEAKEKLASIK